jgi:hypothetical protein
MERTSKGLLAWLFFAVVTGFTGCGPLPENTLLPAERIEVGPGPEDMVLDTLNGMPRLLISCTARRESFPPYGEIESLDLGTLQRRVMARCSEPEGIVFRPHGIYLDGRMLCVISHEKEPDIHSILIYRVEGDSLEFTERIDSPLQHSPNALVTGPNGEIYFVNDSGKRGSLAEKIFRLRRANVVRIKKGNDGHCESQIVASGLGYPAGINRIGDRLYVGDALLHRIHVFNISAVGLVPDSPIRKLRGNDNIRIYHGKILTPGHVKPFRFIRHAGNPEKKSPVEVFLADPGTGEITLLFRSDGSLISAGSTVVIFNGTLYIGQVFEPFILKVTLAEDGPI